MKMSLMQIRQLEPNADGVLTGPILEEQMAKDIDDGLIPTFVVGTLGTTGFCAYDDITTITGACRKMESDKRLIWVHVDSAYVGSMLVLPEERGHILDGVGQVDSFNTNLSKGFFVS